MTARVGRFLLPLFGGVDGVRFAVRAFDRVPWPVSVSVDLCVLLEQLPDVAKRDELRARLRQVLARSREADGSWNDRQFGRSGGYGTAFAIMTLHMPHLPKPCEWRPSAAPSADTKAGAPK